MLKSCSFCGKLHRFDEECPKRIEYQKLNVRKYDRNADRNSKQDLFRNTVKWRQKREEIRQRDLNMCRVCFLLEHRITTSGLSVHHIVPIHENYRLRLTNGNLITLCARHHEQAESGRIKADRLRALTKEKMKL